MSVTVIAALGACGKPAGVIFEPMDSPLVWPAPPEAPRIQYVGQLSSSTDLKPARSFPKLLGQALFGAAASQSMLSPFALCTDGEARVFVCDSNAQLVHVFDLDSRRYAQWRPDEASLGFAQPIGVAYDTAGQRLFVSDPVIGAIFVFDEDGATLDIWAEESVMRPTGLVIDAETRHLFVADPGTHQVVVLSLDGELIDVIGRRGVQLGEFNYPTGVALDSAGRLYVCDSLNFRIQVFGRDLTPIRQIGSKGDLPGYFGLPKGLAIDSEDHVYVLDAHFEVVQIFDADGVLLMTFGEEGHGAGQFWLPTGLHIDVNDRIWIADSYNRRVQVFDFNPKDLP